MRAIGFVAIMLVAVPAHAGSTDGSDRARNWSRRFEALARSLTGERAADREVIRPSGNIDPKMVLVPRQNQGRMRIITPPGTGR